MALSELSGDEQGVVLGQLRNTLEPRLVMYFSSASKELRALLPPAVQQQRRTDYEEATALCLKVGMPDSKELREATGVEWYEKGLTAADLATLAKLGSVLPALEALTLYERSGSAGPEGVQRLAEGLVAGSLPAVAILSMIGIYVGDAGASALAAALDRAAAGRLGPGRRQAPRRLRRPRAYRRCQEGSRPVARPRPAPPPAATRRRGWLSLRVR